MFCTEAAYREGFRDACVSHQAASAAQQAVEADGRASSCPPPSFLSPVVITAGSLIASCQLVVS
jgi:hypothetical protein